MRRVTNYLFDIGISLLVAAVAFYSTMLLARQVVDSSLYRQSRIISMLVQQDPAGFSSLLSDTRDIHLFIKFAGALASAYINFELIPLNEAATFVAVFESLPDGVEVDGFAYHRKDLTITGSAATQSDYAEFVAALREREYFAEVQAQSYDTTNDTVRFSLNCISGFAEVHPE